ncbi:unnamed protein product [Ixodes pacificus]
MPCLQFSERSPIMLSSIHISFLYPSQRIPGRSQTSASQMPNTLRN